MTAVAEMGLIWALIGMVVWFAAAYWGAKLEQRERQAAFDALPEENFVQTENGRQNKVASIPTEIAEDLQKQGIWDDSERLKAWLNDPKNMEWRTSRGRV